MSTATTNTVIGLFQSRAAAEHAVEALRNGGFSSDQMSVITRDAAEDIPNIGPVETVGSFDAGTGAAVGGFAGFVGGILALAIPGIGPILAAGPLAAGIMGGAIGAAAGGLIGSLKEHGVPENDAAHLAEAIRSGRVMIAVHVPSDHAHKAADIMDDNGALDTDDLEGVDATATTGEVTPVRPISARTAEAIRANEQESLMERELDRERRTSIYPGITGMGSGPND